jgi:hypothetical protein
MLPKERLEILHDLTQHPGWGIFEELLKNQEEALDSVANVTTEKELFQSQGQIFHIRQCLAMAQQTRAALDEEDEDTI